MSAPRFLDRKLFDGLAETARTVPRRRYHHGFHALSEPCHRMVVGLQPDSYIAPHCHLDPDKSENLIVLRGQLGLLLFTEGGAVSDTRVMAAGGDCLGVDLPPGTFHALVVLAPDTMMFECKAGPYLPLREDERAAWAPGEGGAGVAEYLAWMRGHFS
ncbi:WbuC family cupin fold metalloprotein [Azomonas macrocytogenes]|uniref:Cupin fold WbuC family metalloprotein n=1 Tax=Azomonas macrocytogenes TaxID=69962 RepID=A0A839T7F1_AZOMA|nr:WbuC family cupin fold metalloprotein [Azomonas macrocytogenes]MBB3104184.1 cupin fold WbuC family metalloprotein [Azomonas macrocytogenes]